MRAELMNTMHLFFVLVFLISIITCTITYLRKYRKKLNYNVVGRIYIKYLDYSRFMIINDYISYEKYDIWRYCVQF
ncbi:hypothetical protein BCD96_003649 [Clostridium beijerinckii]|nr:hypothetical protein [Clostridium beijerinckii]NRT36317.1 hypothetical protein [Clostridium beijerinckii]NRT44255.1 hypothetical protein [Clostridium beijerinckii]NRU37965.1 hypothetical protein [Clostridium beijerinckii]NRZ21752.1 hypothetical protein [Clostridium beijerinckii]